MRLHEIDDLDIRIKWEILNFINEKLKDIYNEKFVFYYEIEKKANEHKWLKKDQLWYLFQLPSYVWDKEYKKKLAAINMEEFKNIIVWVWWDGVFSNIETIIPITKKERKAMEEKLIKITEEHEQWDNDDENENE